MAEGDVQARAVPAERGIGWIGEGVRLFRASPWVWVAVTVLWLLLNTVPNWVPVLGPLAVSLLWPVLAAGLMLGCQAQDQGQPLEVRHLFAGFGPRLGPLVGLGALSLAAGVAVAIVTGLVAAALALTGEVSPRVWEALATGASLSEEEWEALARVALIVLLVGATALTPVVMALWFAPALVALDGLGPVDAVLASFVGCVRNVLPMFLFVLLSSILLVLGAIPLGLGLLAVFPILIGAVYASYREIYGRAQG